MNDAGAVGAKVLELSAEVQSNIIASIRMNELQVLQQVLQLAPLSVAGKSATQFPLHLQDIRVWFSGHKSGQTLTGNACLALPPCVHTVSHECAVLC